LVNRAKFDTLSVVWSLNIIDCRYNIPWNKKAIAIMVSCHLMGSGTKDGNQWRWLDLGGTDCPVWWKLMKLLEGGSCSVQGANIYCVDKLSPKLKH
jgi:hypothetical protein